MPIAELSRGRARVGRAFVRARVCASAREPLSSPAAISDPNGSSTAAFVPVMKRVRRTCEER